jgi:hypothetical protein
LDGKTKLSQLRIGRCILLVRHLDYLLLKEAHPVACDTQRSLWIGGTCTYPRKCAHVLEGNPNVRASIQVETGIPQKQSRLIAIERSLQQGTHPHSDEVFVGDVHVGELAMWVSGT